MKPPSKRFAIPILLILFAGMATAQPPFKLNGGAYYLTDDCFQLTTLDSLHKASSAWCAVPLALTNSFDMRFMVNLGCSPKQGEGMAFVIHADPDTTTAVGCPGGALGFALTPMYMCSPVSPSLAIEIDTRYTAIIKRSELQSEHMALVKNGLLLSPLLPPVPIASPQGTVKDCRYHSFRVAWKPSDQELHVWWDDELKITYKTDLSLEFFAGAKNVWFGFTASTGDVAADQTVCVRRITLEIDQVHRKRQTFQDGVFIYPNPSEEQVQVELDFPESENITIDVFNSEGKLMLSEKRENVTKQNLTLQLNGFSSGIYYISVGNGTNRVSKRMLFIANPKA